MSPDAAYINVKVSRSENGQLIQKEGYDLLIPSTSPVLMALMKEAQTQLKTRSEWVPRSGAKRSATDSPSDYNKPYKKAYRRQ